MPDTAMSTYGVDEQQVMGILSYLLQNGVTPDAIYGSVSYALDLRVGDSISGDDHLRRAFVLEQVGRLARG